MRLPTVMVALTACVGEPPQAPEEPAQTMPEVPAPAPAPEAAKPRVVLDVLKLVGLDQAAAKEMLGEPAKCETVSPNGVGRVPKCDYLGGNVEVVFIDGKADGCRSSAATAETRSGLDRAAA